jgi:hypothetical protein
LTFHWLQSLYCYRLEGILNDLGHFLIQNQDHAEWALLSLWSWYRNRNTQSLISLLLHLRCLPFCLPLGDLWLDNDYMFDLTFCTVYVATPRFAGRRLSWYLRQRDYGAVCACIPGNLKEKEIYRWELFFCCAPSVIGTDVLVHGGLYSRVAGLLSRWFQFRCAREEEQ